MTQHEISSFEIIPNTEKAVTNYDNKNQLYGTSIFRITMDDIVALIKGKQLVTTNGEYTIAVHLDKYKTEMEEKNEQIK